MIITIIVTLTLMLSPSAMTIATLTMILDPMMMSFSTLRTIGATMALLAKAWSCTAAWIAVIIVTGQISL